MPKIAGEDHDPDAILEATPDEVRTWDAESLQAYIDRAGPLHLEIMNRAEELMVQARPLNEGLYVARNRLIELGKKV